MKEKIKRIAKILLVAFILLTALVFWSEKALNFIAGDMAENCYDGTEIAILQLNGKIVPYFTNEDEAETSSAEFISCLGLIKEDGFIKGVVIEISSYGGSPYASTEIMNAIKNIGKPTVAVIRESAVSGGYLVASAADRIFANEVSEIGGIGVTMSYLDYSQKNNTEGIIFQELSTGKFKNYGDPDKSLTDEEKELIMRDLKIMHDAFVSHVSKNRKLDIEKVKNLADGSSMLGKMAKENGLIETIGDIESAKAWLSQ